MVRVLVALLLSVALSFGGSLLDQLHNLNATQKKVLQETFEDGKIHGLEYSLTAIAWRESDFGENLVGKTDDWGVFQITIKTFKVDFPEYAKIHTDAELRELLKTDFNLNIQAAVKVIRFWQKERGPTNWRAVYSGYNGGYKGNPAYAEMIVRRIAALRVYMKEIK